MTLFSSSYLIFSSNTFSCLLPVLHFRLAFLLVFPRLLLSPHQCVVYFVAEIVKFANIERERESM